MSHHLTCRIGREWYGIHISHVLEVLHLVALNDVPDERVVGVMTLREQIIPVVDLRQYFRLDQPEFDMDTPIVAVRYGDKRVGLIVDEADEVIEIPESVVTPYDEGGIHDVARVSERMYFLLDVPFLIHSLKQSGHLNN